MNATSDAAASYAGASASRRFREGSEAAAIASSLGRCDGTAAKSVLEKELCAAEVADTDMEI
ncbi:MAG: hypothetical protein LBB38_01560 [Puniceicoccales bacterium]|nr:hypothetical protein [Puniceicoccales bacterium]